MPNDSLVWYVDRFQVLSHAAAIAPPEGLILEFGVASGATINHLACSYPLRERRLFGFDSFCGLPEPWADYPVGHFACEPPTVAANVELVVGLFSETLPPFLARHEGPCALIHLDADLYSSTRTVLTALDARIVAGTTIALDEYFVEGSEQRAFNEWIVATGRRWRPEARACEQLVVTMME
jgi:Methyltransferase domain